MSGLIDIACCCGMTDVNETATTTTTTEPISSTSTSTSTYDRLLYASQSMINDIKLFSLDGHIVNALVTSVYDGDTCTVMFTLPGTDLLTKFKLRMYGYDSPEMKPRKDIPQRDEHIAAAHRARDELIRLIGGHERIENGGQRRIVQIHCMDWDKYGRLLGRVYFTEPGTNVRVDVNQYMIDAGYAKSYDGGTKSDLTSIIMK